MKEWSLKDKEQATLYFLTYKCKDIETLRLKLIEDLCPELLADGEPYSKHDHIPQHKIYKIICKRFGVDE